MACKRPRRELMSLSSIPQSIVQHIAFFIPVAKDFLSFLASFPDATSIGDLQSFLELSNILRPNDLWPKLQLKEMTPSLVPSVRRIAFFFTTMYVFKVFDVKLLQQCLHPHNIVELLQSPMRRAVYDWLKTPLSILPVQHIKIGFACEFSSACFLDQLGSMAHLVSLSLERCTFFPRDLDRLFAFIEELTRLSLSTLYKSKRLDEHDVSNSGREKPPGRFRHRHLEALTAWLRHCPVTSISLGNWFVVQEDSSSAVELLKTIFASSTLENVSLDMERFDRYIQAAMFPARFCMQSLELSYCSLNVTTMAALATGLRHSNITSLTLDTSNIDGAILPSLLDALLDTNVRQLSLSFESLEDDECALIAAALPSLTIIELNLCCNELTDRSAKVLSEVVGRATSLTSLVLSENDIDLEGATALVKALSERPQVTTWLDLSWNRMKEAEAVCLYDMVEKTPQILSANFK
ncbi:unnamed protein product [Aphanomyces euteiches]